MGMNTDIMHDFVSQEIKRIYASSDGWKVAAQSQENNYDAVYRLERLNRNFQKEIVKVGVTFEKTVSPGLISAITKPESTNDGMVPRFSSSLIVPLNADTTALPGTIPVYQMKSFGFDGENLIWLKKPVRKTETTPQKAVAH
jgi:hypothetical protein